MLKITSFSASKSIIGNEVKMNRNHKIALNLQHFAKENLTVAGDITVKAREIDFVTRFAKNWDALRTILGIMRPIPKAPGTRLVSYKTSMKNDTLQGGASVGEGEEIPYTEFQIEPVSYDDITLEKYAKAVSIEAVNKYGAEVAVQRTDDEFLNQLQNSVLTRFYAFLKTGTLRSAEATWQMALAMAKGKVIDKFNKMRRTVTEIVGFVNVLDVYKYVGGADVTIQTAFGLQYIQNFMGYSTLFLLSDPDIPLGTVIALPIENIDLYYVDPSNSDFAKLGLNFTVAGETNLIGFHAEGDYKHAVGESFALMGMTLWAEYIDGIAVIEVDDSNLTDLTVSADAPDATYPWTEKTPSDFQSNVTVKDGEISGDLTFIEGGLASSGPLAGDGYFLAVKFSDFASGLTYANVDVGLVPSASGMDLQTLDSDKNAVFKITDKANQKLKVVQTDGAGHKNIQYFGLSSLNLEAVGV